MKYCTQGREKTRESRVQNESPELKILDSKVQEARPRGIIRHRVYGLDAKIIIMFSKKKKKSSSDDELGSTKYSSLGPLQRVLD